MIMVGSLVMIYEAFMLVIQKLVQGGQEFSAPKYQGEPKEMA